MKFNKVLVPARKNAKNYDTIYNGDRYIILDNPARIAGKLKKYLSSKPLEVYGFNYNGYGWSDHSHSYFLSKKEGIEYKKEFMLPEKKERKILTDEEKKEKWCKRLSKLTGISVEYAMEIACEKIGYKIEKINEMIERQQKIRWSIKREKLINKMERENPLRYIKDKEHAFNILIAHKRHTCSDYEGLLDRARELAEIGEIDRDSVKDYARDNYRIFN